MKIIQFRKITSTLFIIIACTSGTSVLNAQAYKTTAMEQILIKTPAFTQNGMIPSKFTCEGENVLPALDWSDLPGSAKSIVLIVDDPDAPSGDWVHYILFNIPSETRHLSENFKPGNGIKSGKNSRGTLDYHGPCPPSGTHRYFFKLYALDIILDQADGISKKDLMKAIEGHVVAKGELIGLYKKVK